MDVLQLSRWQCSKIRSIAIVQPDPCCLTSTSSGNQMPPFPFCYNRGLISGLVKMLKSLWLRSHQPGWEIRLFGESGKWAKAKCYVLSSPPALNCPENIFKLRAQHWLQPLNKNPQSLMTNSRESQIPLWDERFYDHTVLLYPAPRRAIYILRINFLCITLCLQQH